MPNLTFSTTADGSRTIFNAEVGEYYHSRHGALQESQHVFLQSGLIYYLERSGAANASVLEVGFGTGLNFLLTADYCLRSQVNANYTGIEANPLPLSMISETDYNKYISDNTWSAFLANYENSFNSPVSMGEYCSLEVSHRKLMDFSSDRKFDVVYFDAFAAIHQPEMWTHDSLSQVCSFINTGGIFVTYAITGNLKRSMKALGFSIEKAPGAPGKREMLRAVKR